MKSKSKKIGFKKKTNKSQTIDQNIKDLQEQYEEVDTKKLSSFNDYPLSDATKKALEENEFVTPTEIQKETLIYSFQNKDILGAAKTGSGKTLAFLIPLLEKLFCLKWTPTDGLGALVITPTRELAYQIFETLRKIGKYHDFSAGLVIGGKDLKFETNRLATCNIIICTPGRILQHMDENPNFNPSSMKLLVLDEADRCLDMGFEKTMNAILENLPREDRQTLLFSATQTRSVKDLARLSLEKPIFVSVHEHADKATPDKLTEKYILCELQDKINLLWSFIKTHKRQKLLVFMQSCKQVKYVHELFKRLKCNTTLLALHGKLHQLRRMAIYDEFTQKDSSIVLIATDVAARGLDFPSVDWVVQVDCPEDAKTYLHRVGRTARNSSVGQSLLLLLPSEVDGIFRQFKIHRIPMDQNESKIEVNPKKIFDMQRKIQAHLASDPLLKASAQRAFQAYLKSTYLLKNKDIFNVEKLNIKKFALSFGLANPPRLRYLEKHVGLKIKNDLSDNENSDDDNEDDDILTVKRTNHELEQAEDGTEPDVEDLILENKVKIVTKAALAKKVIKKNIQANQKIMFDEEGQKVLDDTQKKSDLGQKYEMEEEDDEHSGINVAKVKEILKAEDKFDKELAKEKRKAKKREEKMNKKKNDKRNNEKKSVDLEVSDGSDSEGENLDWLPDPDKVYADSPQQSEDEDDEIEENSSKKRKWKPPQKPTKSDNKEPKVKKSKTDANLEDLALQLLQR